ncbi:iron permease FTR1 [Segniliparus rotundus DSM 44985]|uniref:Iron permease FTR1 n=1 Tax=Segniliparus rotundus (strain ATCC BAA-972 / CDC 1076 / CIP 108378 / DSM 44985 / JCM 13578) TaxID=640132 RepID=D6ZC22_SEGRD|nr:iron uptake transporter permease EfeU [Segniliparus rotundus]ADG96999.1 iron permease FTR1 [Segniliparus rotundus DSM 44985]
MLFANALIGLREGLEASIIVTILCAFLVKSGLKSHVKWVWTGVAVALGITVTVFLVITYGSSTLSSLGQEFVGGVASLVAVAIVTTMVLWMRTAAASLSGDLKAALAKAVSLGPAAVVLMSGLAVGREGIETALLVFDTTQSNPSSLYGLLVGVAVAVALAIAMYFGALRINLSAFFKVTGVLLVFVAAGVLRYGVNDLQEAGALPGSERLAFDVSGTIDPNTWPAKLVEGMFNIVPNPTLLSAIAWLVYVVVVLAVFLRPVRPQSAAPPAAQAQRGVSADS